jgi:hypothetical protein
MCGVNVISLGGPARDRRVAVIRRSGDFPAKGVVAMGLDFVSRIKTVAAVASMIIMGASGLGLGQQQKGDTPAPAKGDSSRSEKVAGVILKVDKISRGEAAGSKVGKDGEGKKGPVLLRLSINTNAVWRDWARDQAQVRDEGSPKKDAAKGANSVATKGQPVDENSLVVVEVAPGTRVETRFRSPSDETSKGATSPEKVKSDDSTTSKVAPTGKPVEFRVEDLLPGLFVEAEFRQSGPRDKNTASTVTVIRPISVLESSTATKSSPK